MSEPSSSSNGLNNLLANQPPTSSPPDSKATTSSSSNSPVTSSTVEPTNEGPITAAAPATITTTTTTTPAVQSSSLREDMIKQAVSFLSSPNVRSADKAKKIAFLEKKGLNQTEIDESFKRVGDQAVTNASPSAVNSNVQVTTPVIPVRNYTPPTTQILYYSPPSQPSLPAEKVFALAVILGMGAVGLTAGVVGILRRFISPIFNRIAEYQRTRYNQHKEIADRLLKSLKDYHSQNDDLDALIDQGEEKTVMDAVVKHETELIDKLNKLIEISRAHLSTALKTNTYGDFRSEIMDFRNTLATSASYSSADQNYYSSSASYLRNNTYSSDSPAVAGLKSDIRSLKAVLLNRRNFPTV
ncbi:MAG: peroxisomal membrane anchor protein conserved region-domain-containing protein [Benjaminiella poitrasii]|nr:MAG: peroxisomal membrane anchor protein conserved region-domain-containing protein [Benjaminiella poitrasii]